MTDSGAMSKLRACGVAAVLAVMLSRCSSTHASPTFPSELPQHSILPTEAAGIGLPSSPANEACLSDLLGGHIILTGTTSGVVGRAGTADLPIYWPAGFRAIFNPIFAGVIRPDGMLFALPGEDIAPYTDRGTWRGYSACATRDGIWVFGTATY
jgi:hypothetical protein